MSSSVTIKGEENLVPTHKIGASSSSSHLTAEAEHGTSDSSWQENGGAKHAAAVIQDEPSGINNATPAFVVPPTDQETLVSYFGTALKDELINFHQKVLSMPYAKPAYFGELLSKPITDKSVRGRLHQDIRRIFDSDLETQMLDEGVIKITAAWRSSKPRITGPAKGRRNAISLPPFHRNQGSGNQPKGKVGWDELGGQYLHFSLYKENKDTMEVVSYLATRLHVKPKDFAFAGTKDRRAATVQRVSVYRQRATTLAKLNRELRNARIGNFCHRKHQLQLGELAGNQFIITLRDCHFGDDSALDDLTRIYHACQVVNLAVQHLNAHGFINYFGLQRFGSFSIGTDDIGRKILQGDFKGAVDGILFFSEEARQSALENSSTSRMGKDDIYRAEAIHLFQTTGKVNQAIEKLPRKFSAEASVIRHLGNPRTSKDFVGALMTINRNLRTMYVHAYQSFVWNHVASERWRRYGNSVIEGDLVIIDTQGLKDAMKDEVDENGEVVVHPAGDDVAVTHDDLYERARPLTAEEASSGKYTIFEIVLPTPGFDVEYPANDIGEYYKEFMNSGKGGGLDPANMRRSQKDFSLSGSYRNLIAQVKDLSFDVQRYDDETQQLVETDLQMLDKSKRKGGDDQDNRVYKPDFAGSSGRGGRGGNRGGYRGNRGNQAQYRTTARQDIERNRATYAGSAQLLAWQNLPAKLAAEDKAAAALAEQEKANPPNIDPATSQRFAIEDTWRQTSAENGKKTGLSSVLMHGELDGDADEDNGNTAVAVDNASAVQSAQPSANVLHHQRLPSSASTAHSDSDGGVRLSPQKTSAKRAAEDMSSTVESIPEPPAPTVLHAETSSEGSVSNESHVVLKPCRLGVIVKFSLGSSQYATMALRELMKAGGVKTYKPDFSGGR